MGHQRHVHQTEVENRNEVINMCFQKSHLSIGYPSTNRGYVKTQNESNGNKWRGAQKGHHLTLKMPTGRHLTVQIPTYEQLVRDVLPMPATERYFRVTSHYSGEYSV